MVQGTCILKDGGLTKCGWIAMESATHTNYKEQLVGHLQVKMDKIYGLQHGYWTQHPDPDNAYYPMAVQKIDIDYGKTWK